LAVVGSVIEGGGQTLEVEQHCRLRRWILIPFVPFAFISCEFSFWFDWFDLEFICGRFW